jgi:hypothetical protein
MSLASQSVLVGLSGSVRFVGVDEAVLRLEHRRNFFRSRRIRDGVLSLA